MEVQVIEGQQQTNIEARELAQKTEKWKTKEQTKEYIFFLIHKSSQSSCLNPPCFEILKLTPNVS